MNNVTREDIENFIVAAGARHNARGRAEYPTCDLNWEIITASWGRKFVKLITANEVGPNAGKNRSVYCFVEIATGNIFKAASWAAPAKHARGNIMVGDASNDWNGAMGRYGAAYMR